MRAEINVLFVTWDGPGSTYLEGLFLPLFERLSEFGFAFHVLQFTWSEMEERNSMSKACHERGIGYRNVTVLRRPISIGSALTAIWGGRSVSRAIRELDVSVVIPRSTLPAVATLLAIRRHPHVGFLFDADGLPHDERVDFSGMRPDGATYRVLRDAEALVVRRATAVMTRSEKAVDILLARAGSGTDPEKFYVVGNARDESKFKPLKDEQRHASRQALGVDDESPLLVFVGSSLTGKYCGREIFEFFRVILGRRSSARLLILTSSPQEASQLLKGYEDLKSASIIKTVLPNDVPQLLGACDLGLAFIRPLFSMQAAAAVKLGEYLLCGLPVLATRGVGDSDRVITNEVGFLLDGMGRQNFEEAADWFIDSVLPNSAVFARRCREVGLSKFSFQANLHTYSVAINSAMRW